MLVIFHIEFQLNCCPFLFAMLSQHERFYLDAVFSLSLPLPLLLFGVSSFVWLVAGICYFFHLYQVGKCRFLYGFQCVNV